MPVVGVDDGSFQKGKNEKAKLIAVLLIGAEIKGVKAVCITVDGLDATEALISMIDKWKFDAVFLAGLSFAGFNVISPKAICEKYGKPVVVILRARPNNYAVKSALKKHFSDWKIRWEILQELGAVSEVKILKEAGSVYLGHLGQTSEWACAVVKALSLFGRMPEPLRVAKLIARGVS